MCGRLTAAVLAMGIAWATAAQARRDHRTVWLYNVHTREEIRVRPFGQHGRLAPRAWRRLTRFFRSHRTGQRRTVNPRLVQALAQLQAHFDGRRIELTSGYRTPEDRQSLSSYHQVGRAIDLRLVGVRARDVFEACRRRLGRVGCGLYPNGRHVHVDVRAGPALWVDLSGYGDGARYVRAPGRWLDRNRDAGR